MKHLSLAARYRPQTFAAVAGQPLAALALSRAAAEDKVAPAYLLSGTRGVGKTTIARIFAKALNCEHAPGPEPCNECSQCRHITAGNHVDVNEIDGASNTGVDDVRALRETIGFLPMEGRYKIFIVDEAHMLSKSAFNALLKTLEEPPAHTVFIFATTEAHRFPATIISRCQHFVFRHLSEQALCDHLGHVLAQEKIQYEEEAVRLLARRAAGSVRDSMSLLDQALALSGDKLEAATVAEALGIAGPELFARLLKAVSERDCGQIVSLASGLLASGADLGFFTRELGSTLRNLFLVAQSGEKILSCLGNTTEDEKKFLLAYAPLFTPAHLHAAWQMALESQRGIAQSPEPGASLELLLINLALLPQLLPVGSPDLPRPEETQNSPLTHAAYLPEAAHANLAEASEAASVYSQAGRDRDWNAFCEYCKNQADHEAMPGQLLRLVNVVWTADNLQIEAPKQAIWRSLQQKRTWLEKKIAEYCNGQPPKIVYIEPAKPTGTLAECEQEADVRLCKQILGGRICECEKKENHNA